MKEDNIKYWHYEMKYSSYTDITREADQNEEYDGDDKSTSYSFEGEVIEKKNVSDFLLPFKLEDNQKYYSVYVIYNTGDSFSHHNGAHIVFIDIFTNKEAANELVKRIKSHSDKYDNNIDNSDFDYNVYYNGVNGISKKINASDWLGYFESIQFCDVQPVVINKFINKIKAKL